MIQAGFRGARSSNAGDDFHELWALRQALALLDQDSDLTAVTVEGLTAEDEYGTPLDTWDGVDCALYFGGDSPDSAERIDIVQVKYSTTHPEQAWTIARLTQSSNRSRDNSVVGRLAKAFAGVRRKRPDLVQAGKVSVRFVSNQPVDPAVVSALSIQSAGNEATNTHPGCQSDRGALLASSGLGPNEFEAFARSTDLRECGHESRFVLEDRVLTTISDWTDTDARSAVDHLMRSMRRLMMPEAKGQYITRQWILAQLGVSVLDALFPCPSAIKTAERLVPRRVSRVVLERMLSGSRRICLHGEGGSGKTTALQEIETLLPDGSVLVIFDCYGGGRYLDSDAFRHRPQDAFLQLANDLATRLRIPLLLGRSENVDYPRAFKKRLERAAEVVAARAPDALLVVAVDAADNAITAANTRYPRDKCFVGDFASLGALPRNVRLIVTSRTGQLAELPELKARDFTPIEITGFALPETTAYVRGIWPDAPTDWIEDFHHLSSHNPRVQWYALDYAGPEPPHAIEYLRPNGKGLDQVFAERLEQARQKVGLDRDIKVFCAGLIALPRPVPVATLSAVTDLPEPHIRDLCADLAPGVRLDGESIAFADEDFEQFVRKEAQPELSTILKRIADHLSSCHQSDAYAATHVAAALLAAGRGREVLDLAHSGDEPTAISDPVLRREVHLQRLRIAMKVCRESGNNVDAMLTFLRGAKALKTDTTIRRMLVGNPDLAAWCARDTASRVVLRDPDEIQNHGALLMQLMAADSQHANGVLVREGHRQVSAWLRRRAQDFEQQESAHPGIHAEGWPISDRDIAAETEAVLRISGPQHALENLLRWRPKATALSVASILSSRLITRGEESLVDRWLDEGPVPTPWDLFLLTPLALAGNDVDISRLQASLSTLVRRGLIRSDWLRDTWREEDATASYFDTIVTACEIVVARGGDHDSVLPVLERLADPELRRPDRLSTSQVSLIDCTLRSHILLERIAGRTPTLETYCADPPEEPTTLSEQEAAHVREPDRDRKGEVEAFIGPLVAIYDIRTQALIGSISPADADAELSSAIAKYHSAAYRLSRNFHAHAVRARAALTITRLMALQRLERSAVLKHVNSLLGTRPGPLGVWEPQVLANLALDRSLHEEILRAIAVRARAVKGTRMSAEEKCAALVEFARLLLPISAEDAKSLFSDAVEVAGEVDTEAVHEIALFAPLVERAEADIGADQKRAVARDLATVVSDARIRLAGQDGFPWAESARALATLDANLALAATGRWEDSGIVDRQTFLPAVLDMALSRGELSPVKVVALSRLLDQFGVELTLRVIQKASCQNEGTDLTLISEELAREELLRFGRGRRSRVSDELTFRLAKGDPGYWQERLAQATAFHQAAGPSQTDAAHDEEQLRYHRQNEEEESAALSTIDWAAHRFDTADDIDATIASALASARAMDAHLPVSTIFDRMRSVVGLRDRAAHIEALSQSQSQDVADYELARAIAKSIDDWRHTPAVGRWCQEHLLRTVVGLLPGFCRWLTIGESPLPALLEKSGLTDQQICIALLAGMERHVDTLSAGTLYALIGLIGRYCTPNEATQVVIRYAAQLVQRIPAQDRDHWDLADIPDEETGGVARFLYALMGDVDVRVRWRAAHAVRCLVRLGDVNTLDSLIELWDRTSEASFRRPDAPFYWLAARLWTVIALDRTADEAPLVVGRHGRRLLEIAADEEFPHVLVRSFAKSAVCKLIESGSLRLAPSELGLLEQANTSPVRRREVEPSRSIGFDRYARKEHNEGRRFSFDSLDTLPYWYTEALRAFADVTEDEFLDVAERWIVDFWEVKDDPWQWLDEPRRNRVSDDSSHMDHRNGSRPSLERFHTYLEWHAMWCATGELMRTRALARFREGDYDDRYRLEDWLDRESLTAPPLWLADLHGMKPLEDRLWYPPQGDIDAWVESVSNDDFSVELAWANGSDVIVAAHHDTRSPDFLLSVRVNTALVSPDTASALVRALQTIDDSWDYRLPPAGDELEIDAAPYKLVGWLSDSEHELGIDQHDPLRYDLRPVERCPADMVARVLNLDLQYGDQVKWVRRGSGHAAFVYEAWGDNRGDEREDRLRYDTAVRSSGWRIRANKEALSAYLTEVGLDLIVEVEVTRRNSGYDYWRHDEKGKKEARFDTVVLLRRDGTVEGAEGRLGTWTAPRT